MVRRKNWSNSGGGLAESGSYVVFGTIEELDKVVSMLVGSECDGAGSFPLLAGDA